MAKLRKPRLAARAKHDEPATATPEHTAHGTGPLDEAHVGVPRWRPPISSTPDEGEAAHDDHELTDDDDTLEFERPRPLI